MRIEEANAKINVYLDVTSRLENGYHNIISVMQAVSLCDIVSVDFNPLEQSSVLLSATRNANMPTDEKNIAYRAALRFLEAVGMRGRITIHIDKRIPMAAGLAGGSADAAAVLRAMNKLCHTPMTMDELCKVGASLGADVPFCIRGGSALVSGIGDIQREITPMPPSYIVIACMGSGVSTPYAYALLDEKYDYFRQPHIPPVDHTDILDAWQKNDSAIACRSYFNIFEDVIEKTYPSISLLKREMIKHGAIKSMMSGSGPSVFGIFSSLQAAQNAHAHLIALGADAHIAHPKEREAFLLL